MCLQVELQKHPFFASINWNDLLARKVTAPFIPKVVRVIQKLVLRTNFFLFTVYLSVCMSLQTGPCDVSYIDPEFTLQPLPASVNDRCQVGVASEAFLGFSYMNPVEYVAAELVS